MEESGYYDVSFVLVVKVEFRVFLKFYNLYILNDFEFVVYFSVVKIF